MDRSQTAADTQAAAPGGKAFPKVSIVIPAFNEAHRIGDSIRKVSQFIEASNLAMELIVVDDGSSDETAAIVRQMQIPGLRLLRNGENHGKGYSVCQGALAATGTYVLFTDADLSAPIEELTRLLDVAINDNADIVVGSRAIDRSFIQRRQSRARELGGILYNRFVRLALGLDIHDTQCGFKLFHRERTRPIFERQTRQGFGFDPELLFLARQRGLKILEIPVKWSHVEGSKVKLLRDGLRMIADVIRIRWNGWSGRYR